MKSVKSLICILFLMSIGFTDNALAGRTKAVLHGKVVAVPCYINGKQALDFDFGRIGVKHVDGVSNAVTVDVPVTCDKTMNSNLMVKISGVKLNASKINVLETTVSNLGVALYDDVQNKELPLGTEWMIDSSQVFRIKAVLVKEDDKKTLEAKPFTVMATVVAFYE